jgi:HD-like signal output (HDOD) protein
MQIVFTQMRQDPDLQLNQALQENIGIDFHSATGRLAEAWKLPETLVVAMSEHSNSTYQDENWQLASLVGVGVRMVSTLYHRLPWQADEHRLYKLSISTADSNELFERLSVQFDRTRELASSLFKG